MATNGYSKATAQLNTDNYSNEFDRYKDSHSNSKRQQHKQQSNINNSLNKANTEKTKFSNNENGNCTNV